MREIISIYGREILDSRGLPTIEVDVELADGSFGRASVPSGSSVGTLEAVELRDEDELRFKGKGVLKAVEAINTEINEHLIGIDGLEQFYVDQALVELDNTEHKSRLGANAILGVSLAVARAAANSLHIPLYKYIGGSNARVMPMPMMNVINGGKHADNNLSIQEFMIIPIGAENIADAIRMGCEVNYTLRDILKQKGYSVNIGDEGGFAPNLEYNEEAIELIIKSIHDSGYKLNSDFVLAIDSAASEFFMDTHYQIDNQKFTTDELINFYHKLVDDYPIVSIEDALSEHDRSGWKDLTAALGSKIQLVADDLFVTNPQLLQEGINDQLANAILVKPNQIGTITEMLNTVRIAHDSGYKVIMSHRSGETEDSTIAHLAIGTNCGQIKTGGLCRSDRMAKYNELLRIYETIGEEAYFNKNIFKNHHYERGDE
ncbi:phosphopyruvate hydratase [Rickettsiales endosymbiont of Stachyamoeba lipophora]|uniref:phosphopyruvate hydratase n=1 Tax=Rickettsiales endosymbiont of Stachyamoeba lipophora TaxID=2486578 RepID=UPI000F6541E5|nr:phosphopyruvate hydratase [Rickettsiales endosymbiont of Stachyamoeba lipophora]AZL15954.1 phosphopyruvate hydratase [Rickettsiales endosymbiont of Stachyamoeba lipophora]